MSDLTADTSDLQQLATALGELHSYVTHLQQAAGGFAYMLPGEWQGPSSAQFVAAFESWSQNAHLLAQQTDGLHQLVKAAHDAYDAAISTLDESWSSAKTGLGA